MVNLVADFLLPPTSLAIFALGFLLIGGRRARIAAAAMIAVLILLGLPLVSTALLNSLAPTSQTIKGPPPAAVVILSADAVRLEGVVDLDPGLLTLDRIRAGAALARRTGLPILVSGGRISNANTTLAAMMAASLTGDFGLQTRWQEDRSRDTWENAKFSAELLEQAGIKRVFLVTHDWHMRRSLLAFRHFGMDPVPVPVRPPYTPPFSWRRLLVSSTAWFNSHLALHEWLGLAYYAVRE